ncbi:armadillo-type protein [Glomus cerebriforme]|uniref:Armadillo-type protein n=1 Tax=Glomus cerebriforme TaxID=658196 RepID=A0A397TBN2_9GLOM|nr:armadillo-type protein [Glomus cerebriforme]
MNKNKNSLQNLKNSYKEDELYDNKEVNVDKEFNEKNCCGCEEIINSHLKLINSLTVRVELLETEHVVKDQDIEKIKQKLKSFGVNGNNSFGSYSFGGYTLSSPFTAKRKDQAIKNGLKIKVEGHKDEECSISVLYNVRMIDDLTTVQYPPHIKMPDPRLNCNAEPGKFKYDIEFMLQFMDFCKKRPKNLQPVNYRENTRKRKPQIRDEMTSPTDIIGEIELDRTPRRRDRRDRRDSLKGVHQVQEPNIGREQVVPPERSEERLVPASVSGTLPKVTENIVPIEVVQHEVRELLKNLTLESFDSISDQIIKYANKSRDERDGHILREIINLIIERLKPKNVCAIYARLCHKMIRRLDPGIMNVDVKNTEGKVIKGGTLFRNYLLNRCQEDFEKGWKIPSNEKGELNLAADAAKSRKQIKRRGLGLICFIGELFKLNMVTERIIHRCIEKLLKFQDLPEEEEMESLCELMNTVGKQLDQVKMESYFIFMEKITKLPDLSTRIKSMIMGIIDLRNNAWKPLNSPKTENVAKQKEETESPRTANSSDRERAQNDLGRPDHQSDKVTTSQESSASSSGNDGWSTVVSRSSSQKNKEKVGDLTKFGSVNRSKISGKINLVPGGRFGVLSSGGAKGWI